jgi:hypothetical protein
MDWKFWLVVWFAFTVAAYFVALQRGDFDVIEENRVSNGMPYLGAFVYMVIFVLPPLYLLYSAFHIAGEHLVRKKTQDVTVGNEAEAVEPPANGDGGSSHQAAAPSHQPRLVKIDRSKKRKRGRKHSQRRRSTD